MNNIGIKFICPNCQKREDYYTIGRIVECPKCESKYQLNEPKWERV